MSSVIDSATDVVSDVVGGVGDAVSGAVDVVGDIGETVVNEVEDYDFEDALATYIQTGNPYAAAYAGTSGDEKMGFDYGIKGGSDNESAPAPEVSYDPSTDSFGFADPKVYGGDMPNVEAYPGQSIIEPFATKAVQGFAKSALEQDQATQDQMIGLANLTLEGLGGLQEMISAGEFEKTPSLSFFNAERPQSNILSRYDQAKANLNNIMRPEGLIDSQGRLGIFENYFEQRGLI
tara:strand:+ start:1720 stop:2421 length:702 start_codon:yes stop_codon:yes gene_type:complete